MEFPIRKLRQACAFLMAEKPIAQVTSDTLSI
jgi:hypothetical protein